MALMKVMGNCGATACWCPSSAGSEKSLLAVGTKGSTSFDDMGGELRILDTSTKYAGTDMVLKAKVRAKYVNDRRKRVLRIESYAD